MNTHDNTPDSAHDDTMPQSLRWSLRGLRRELPPERDLWPAIAGRIANVAQQPASAPQHVRSRSIASRAVPAYRRPASLATAALLLVALGIGWQLRPLQTTGSTIDPNAQLIAREAAAMTVEYGAALRELDSSHAPLSTQPALRELDRSAAQVRTALARDPDARFLLDRLQRLYAQRLALTQRLAALT